MRNVFVDKLISQAFSALDGGSPREAIATFKRVLKFDPDNGVALQHLYEYHAWRKDHREAARYLARLVGGHPVPEDLMEVAHLHELADDLPEAIAVYRRVVQICKTKWRAEDVRRLAEHQAAALGAKLQARLERARKPSPPTPPPRPAGRPGLTERHDIRSEPTSPRPAEITTPARRPQIEPIEVRTVILGEGSGTGSAAPEAPVSPIPPASTGPPQLAWLRLRLDYHRLTLLRDYEELVCLPSLHAVRKLSYQVETVKRVLRDFGGRVLLADEVGLGKTVEAGMALKEFVMRGLVKTVLVLTPPGLVTQWKEELLSKFDLPFLTSDDVDVASHPEFWDAPRIIASIGLARSRGHFDRVTSRERDLVIVDEAHRLKSRATQAWKLVNALGRKYTFLLSATPVENDLVELYNLITLLKPGALKTEGDFRRRYTTKGKAVKPANPEELRELLRGVMVRNTRSLVDLKLPKRFASTLLVEPSPEERAIYDGVSALVRSRGGDGATEAESEAESGTESRAGNRARGSRLYLSTLLREAGSAPSALKATLERDPSPAAQSLAAAIGALHETEKAKRLVRLLKEKPGEKVIVFTQFKGALEELERVLSRHAIAPAVYHGGLSATEKERAIALFRDEATVLLSTESGGEGHNLQFASTLVNFDIPWNPMRIEQRIGRLHRIGQTRDVFVFNLVSKGTLEHHLLEVLERKINLFELVIGEVDMILGHLGEEGELDDVVFDLWRKAGGPEEERTLFDGLGERLASARAAYQDSRKLDDALFREEYEA